LFISKSTIGKSIRAVSQDFEAAKLVGINTDKILMTTVMISALLVGFAAVLYAPGNFIAPRIGWRYLLLAFSVTIFGGMGSIPGSIIGSFIMGYATAFTDFFISPSFSVLIPIVVILVMLLVRPQGLLGKKELQ
jgi:branched-chain amino acid transport system permease protein